MIKVSLIANKKGTEKKVNVQLSVPYYMERFIVNDIKGNLRINLLNSGYNENYKYSSQFPKITIIIE